MATVRGPLPRTSDEPTGSTVNLCTALTGNVDSTNTNVTLTADVYFPAV